MKTLVRPALRRPVAATARTGAPAQPSRALRSPHVRKSDLVTTATLLRGRVYFYGGVEFAKGVETAIDQALLDRFQVTKWTPEEFAEDVADLYEEVVDSDQERFAKPIFEVRHNRPRPKSQEEVEREIRPRRVRQFVEWEDRREPPQEPRRTSGRPERTVGVARR